MDLRDLNNRFSTYLESSWSPDQVAPFGLVYIKLLRMFSDDLTKSEYTAILEKEKQLSIVVLHAFEKKTQRTAKSDIELGRQRLRSL